MLGQAPFWMIWLVTSGISTLLGRVWPIAYLVLLYRDLTARER